MNFRTEQGRLLRWQTIGCFETAHRKGPKKLMDINAKSEVFTRVGKERKLRQAILLDSLIPIFNLIARLHV